MMQIGLLLLDVGSCVGSYFLFLFSLKSTKVSAFTLMYVQKISTHSISTSLFCVPRLLSLCILCHPTFLCVPVYSPIAFYPCSSPQSSDVMIHERAVNQSRTSHGFLALTLEGIQFGHDLSMVAMIKMSLQCSFISE